MIQGWVVVRQKQKVNGRGGQTRREQRDDGKVDVDGEQTDIYIYREREGKESQREVDVEIKKETR